MENVIDIQGLTKTYKNGRGIVDINLSIKEKVVFGLLGANGAGKTTLIKGMTKLLNINNGDVKIAGYSMETEYEKAAYEMGCIIGEASPYLYLTGYENLLLTSNYYDDINEEEINQVLRQTGIFQYKDEKVKNYSTGMKQRLNLANAILAKPKVLILDEPFSGMDIEAKRLIRQLISKLAEEENMTVLISSHQIGELVDICTRIGVIDEGRLISDKSMEEILEDFESVENYYMKMITRRRNQNEYAINNL